MKFKCVDRSGKKLSYFIKPGDQATLIDCGTTKFNIKW